MAVPLAVTRDENQLGVGESPPNELVRRLAEWGFDLDLPNILQARHPVKPAAADHSDH
jgi:hypothetical protein